MTSLRTPTCRDATRIRGFGAAVGDLVAAISDHPSIEDEVCQSYYGYQARRYLLDERSIRALPLRRISARGSDWEMFPVL
jgi:hypothetical protein